MMLAETTLAFESKNKMTTKFPRLRLRPRPNLMTDNKTKTNMLASEMFGLQIAVQTNILALRPNPNIWLQDQD